MTSLACTQSRGRTGMEVNPLVFETSASTDSAIWAFDAAKVRHLFFLTKVFQPFFTLLQLYCL